MQLQQGQNTLAQNLACSFLTAIDLEPSPATLAISTVILLHLREAGMALAIAQGSGSFPNAI